jgi:hypothetical protein
MIQKFTRYQANRITILARHIKYLEYEFDRMRSQNKGLEGQYRNQVTIITGLETQPESKYQDSFDTFI